MKASLYLTQRLSVVVQRVEGKVVPNPEAFPERQHGCSIGHN